MADRPKRNIKKPVPVYVPDEDMTFDDDISVSSGEVDLSDVSSTVEYDSEELDSDEEKEEGNRKRKRSDEDYEYDDFVVRDSEEDSEYLESTDSEESFIDSSEEEDEE